MYVYVEHNFELGTADLKFLKLWIEYLAQYSPLMESLHPLRPIGHDLRCGQYLLPPITRRW